jgi:Calcium-dependent channel, 7TM region, putative phosphate/Cytosolic domain of 10TM putative phosphate transporter
LALIKPTYFLTDGKGKKKSRPVINTGGFLGCGGRKVDAIEFYTKKSSDLEKEVKQLRAKLADTKAANYGWLAFSKVSVAHSVARRLADGKHFETTFAKELDKPKVLLAPSPADVIWGNLGMNVTVRRTKRLVGTAIYWALVFLWILPITALSATSNIKNFLRLVDPTSNFATNFPILVGLIEQWFSPIVFSLFFIFFPMMLRFLSQQQGYISQSSLDRQVFSKLYAFFIINNLCIFSLSNMILAIYGQIRNIIVHQGTGADLVESVSSNVNQLAMNLASVSNFWISTETTKALGITMDLAQLVPLVTITLRKFITRPSPRQLQELAKPPEFGYPQNYNLLLFFFTVGLVFSVMSPLILIFTLAYFLIATMTFRYLLL